MPLNLILALLCMLTASCDYVRSTSLPCQEDDFFCSEPSNQKSLLKTIDNSRLLHVARINYKYFRPPSGDFAREISRRGDSGIIILRSLKAENEVDIELFRDVVRTNKLEYNIDVCRSPLSDKDLAEMCKSIKLP